MERAGTSMALRPRCLIYDLYLDTLGGGERVVFAVAEALTQEFEVVVAGPRVPDRYRVTQFGLSPDVRLVAMHPSRYPVATIGQEAAVYLANGVPLPSFARRSALILQFPFDSVTRWPGLRQVQRRALGTYRTFVYSEFAATWTRLRMGLDPTVAHPPAQLASFVPDLNARSATILAVGRFFDVEHAKRHDVLIEAFQQLPAAVQRTWTLVLAGGVDRRPAGRQYVDRLQRQAQGSNIQFELDVSAERLEQLQSTASLFWHATGYGRGPDRPERAEHFGLSTLEAMSFGVPPLVYADGGQPEIVTPTSGVLWRSVDELVDATVRLVGDPIARRAMAEASALRAQSFSTDALPQAIRSWVRPAPAA